jgi:hypothetical protein
VIFTALRPPQGFGDSQYDQNQGGNGHRSLCRSGEEAEDSNGYPVPDLRHDVLRDRSIARYSQISAKPPRIFGDRIAREIIA